jgi:predicted permease
MPISEILKVIAPIIIITGVGYVFSRLKKINIKTLADFIIYISTPALALTLLSKQQIILKEISTIILSAVLVILGTGLVAYLFSKITRISIPTGLYLPIMFMNSGFIGYPLALFGFGALGLSKAIIYDIMNAVLIFTVGIYMVSLGKDRWQFLKIPFIYAALAGIVISLTGIKIPGFIYSPLNLIGGTTIPLALFMLGCRLAHTKIVSWKLPLLASCFRLGIGFGLGFLAVFLFKVPGVSAKIVILTSSLSSAVTTVALAEEYEADPELVASTIALSTLLSIITIIIILNWLK